jgi:hypothetical protein
MATSPHGDTPRDAVGIWLKRLALAATTVLLGFCCWFVWRVSMVAYQVESAITSISADVKQMSSTGAQISQHLQQLDLRLRAIEEKAANAANLDEVQHMLDEIGAIRESKSAPATDVSADTSQEIDHLLSQIRRSKYRFAYSDEDKSGTRFYLQLYAKYRAYENLLTSSEDFIEKVGTTTIAGQPYRVVIDVDQSVPLNEWLADELKQYRENPSYTESDEKD